jgi:hypothetical protein
MREWKNEDKAPDTDEIGSQDIEGKPTGIDHYRSAPQVQRTQKRRDTGILFRQNARIHQCRRGRCDFSQRYQNHEDSNFYFMHEKHICLGSFLGDDDMKKGQSLKEKFIKEVDALLKKEDRAMTVSEMLPLIRDRNPQSMMLGNVHANRAGQFLRVAKNIHSAGLMTTGLDKGVTLWQRNQR